MRGVTWETPHPHFPPNIYIGFRSRNLILLPCHRVKFAIKVMKFKLQTLYLYRPMRIQEVAESSKGSSWEEKKGYHREQNISGILPAESSEEKSYKSPRTLKRFLKKKTHIYIYIYTMSLILYFILYYFRKDGS